VNSHSFPPRPVPDRSPRALHEDRPGHAQSQIDSQALFKGATEIVIDHEGAKYRLRITRQGKLILNK
jgi:hemin uptake protein HemP